MNNKIMVWSTSKKRWRFLKHVPEGLLHTDDKLLACVTNERDFRYLSMKELLKTYNMLTLRIVDQEIRVLSIFRSKL